MSSQAIKEYCPTCGHKINKTALRLSSLKFRRHLNNIKNTDELISSKEYLIRFIGAHCRSSVCITTFQEELEKLIIEDNIDDTRNWIFGFIHDTKEVELYQFLKSIYYDDKEDPAMATTFTDFYDNYCQYIDVPLNKNRVSRALSAFGLKPVLKKVVVDNKRTSCIMIYADKDKLSSLLRTNGIID